MTISSIYDHTKHFISLLDSIFLEDHLNKHGTQWATKWTFGEKSKVYFCKIQIVLHILRTMGYLIALKFFLQSSNRVENQLVKNQP